MNFRTDRPLSPPVLVLGHSRPDTTARVIESLRAVRPERIYLAVDGPRPLVEGEAAKVRSVQEVMLGGIDWPCEVETLFREENLGIKEGVADAITWFFDQEDEGIILEDDCVPNGSFFAYCRAMLDMYRDEPQVMHIGGYCYPDGVDPPSSYFFSRYPLVWGWAGWADRWRDFTLDGSRFEPLLDELSSTFPDREQEEYWRSVIGKVLLGEIRSWDYFWAMSIWNRGGLAVQSTVPLVQNIGFTREATNTSRWKDYRGFGSRTTREMTSIQFPPTVEWDEELDRQVFEAMYRKPAIPVRLFGALRQALRRR